MWLMQIMLSDKWITLGFDLPAGRVAYKYNEKEDARRMLEKLHPKLPSDRKRVVQEK